MLRRSSITALVASTSLALPLPVLAEPAPGKCREPQCTEQADRLVEKYERFAGSHKNAFGLVDGLREDTQINLSTGGQTTTFTPATGEMGTGEVDHALALAKASLAKLGIHNPTPDQIKAALNGGSVTTKSGQRVMLPGVLKLRASGMGWGEIAHQLGFKLGDLKHADKKPDHKHARAKDDHKPEHFQRAKFERPHRPEKFERPQRPERPEKPERHRR